MSKLKKNEIDQEIIRIKVEIETLELQRNNVSISGAYYELATKAIKHREEEINNLRIYRLGL